MCRFGEASETALMETHGLDSIASSDGLSDAESLVFFFSSFRSCNVCVCVCDVVLRMMMIAKRRMSQKTLKVQNVFIYLVYPHNPDPPHTVSSLNTVSKPRHRPLHNSVFQSSRAVLAVHRFGPRKLKELVD
ncbi:hypothetical protein PGTUg99_011099 [Puccinia graminis f. sp. tritici]|uniref:Uncharacterized protein n=1 Tax=Puccinia graminis f. sp. tritici TaxID=56615 RepID=A0A5B0SFN8_PUCGR|nr:hypothetical protein PGTUg99_011099 [Puccinia graminis f. sp. tritici]